MARAIRVQELEPLALSTTTLIGNLPKPASEEFPIDGDDPRLWDRAGLDGGASSRRKAYCGFDFGPNLINRL